MNVNRRQLLKLMAAMGAVEVHPVMRLLSGSVAEGAVGNDLPNYLFIGQAGAPPRWTYDLLLDPYGNGKLATDESIRNRFKGGKQADGFDDYRLVKRHGIWVPYLWKFEVAKDGGGTKQMSTLLKHLLHIRGIVCPNAGHSFCRQDQQIPIGATTSISALVGELGLDPMPAIFSGMNPSHVFKSATGKSPVVAATRGNVVQELLAPFTEAPLFSDEALEDLTQHLEQVRSELDAMALDLVRGTQQFAETRQLTEKLYKRKFGNLSKQWNRLFGKYQGLIERTLKATYPGINDKPIGAAPADRAKDETNYLYESDLIALPDLRQLIDGNTKLDRLAAGFALSEFIFLEGGISRSISFDAAGFERLQGLSGPDQEFDEHLVGRFPSLYLNSMYNLALSSCLVELVDQLKGAKLWDNTVIHLAGEFNRVPQLVGSGHGSTGASVAIYSGMIEGPHVIGNVTGSDSGPWGQAGQVDVGGASVYLTNANVASTIATMLGVGSPVGRAPSLVKKQGKAIVPVVPKGKSV